MSAEGLTWDLLARVSLPKSERIECRCKQCPKTIYAQIHIIEWSDGRIEPWGSGCYQRELGHTPRGRDMEPRYAGDWGPGMLPELRQLIGTRTDLFIVHLEKLRAEREEAERKAREVAEEAKRNRLAREVEACNARVAADQQIRDQRAQMEAEFNKRNNQAPPPHVTKPRTSAPSLPRWTPPQSEPPPKYASHEPINVPEYLEIRERLEERWRRNGLDFTRGLHRQSLIENALREYNLVRGMHRRS